MRTSRTDPRSRGAALGIAIHVVLLALVMGQVVFLASRLRLRLDLTEDQSFSLTDSTLQLVGNLDQRLVIECYFSPKDNLPAALRETRTVLDNFLDELVQLGKGRVVVKRFDPLADKAVADTCTRLGIKPFDLSTGTTTSLSVNRNWQGLRLLHGGERQKVVEQVAPPSSWLAEATLTPAIKEVLSRVKRKVGFMEWPVEPPPGMAGRVAPIGWNAIRTIDVLAKRYEFQNVKDAEGPLIPAEIDTLVLFRPKDLTDRQKYVLDQFLMRGGRVVAFVDAADYQLGEQRSFARQPIVFDAQDSKHAFLDQLRHYGLELRPKVVADMAQDAQQPQHPFRPFEYLAVPRGGQGQQIHVRYPYFFHPVAFDWATAADRIATDPSTGQVDPELARQYRQRFRPSIDSDEFLFAPFKKIGRGPGFYWPCPVDLRRNNGEPALPEGVTGRVMLWSSPMAMSEEPPPNLNPIGAGDPQSQERTYQAFNQKLLQRLLAEPRHQEPLMVEVQGTFASFFAGLERPRKPSEIKAEEARKAREQEVEKPGEDTAVKEGEDPLTKPVKEQPDAAQDPKPPAPEVQGPPAPDSDATAPKDQEPDPVTRSTAPGRILLVGDSDFLRDDLVTGAHAQRGGPYSLSGPPFWAGMLDWLSEDRDLVALQSRVPVDRKLALVEMQTGEDPAKYEQRRSRKEGLVLWGNVLVPAVLLLTIGLLVWVTRATQKHSFLQSQEK